MDSGQIDFYQHEIVCTNTCRSTKFDLLVNNTRIPPGSALQIAPTPSPLPGEPHPLTLTLTPLRSQVTYQHRVTYCAEQECWPGTSCVILNEIKSGLELIPDL